MDDFLLLMFLNKEELFFAGKNMVPESPVQAQESSEGKGHVRPALQQHCKLSLY